MEDDKVPTREVNGDATGGDPSSIAGEDDKLQRTIAKALITMMQRSPELDMNALMSGIADVRLSNEDEGDDLSISRQRRQAFLTLPPYPDQQMLASAESSLDAPSLPDTADDWLDVYRYRQLQTKTSIRLLDISSCKVHAAETKHDNGLENDLELPLIEIKLVEHDLREQPQYDALSYTWGSPCFVYRMSADLVEPHDAAERSFPIRCDDACVMITQNLFDALLGFLRPDYADEAFVRVAGRSRSRFLWVDALCINQGDVEERNAQVSLMHQIYSEAQTCLVWLGEHDAFSMGALSAMRALAKIPIEQAASLAKDNILETGRDLGEAGSQFRWTDLYALLQRSWFRRAWVVQEVALSRNVIMHCGNRLFDWRYLVRTCLFLSLSGWDKQLERLAKSDMECMPYHDILSRINQGVDRKRWRDPRATRILYQTSYDLLKLPVETILSIANLRARLGRLEMFKPAYTDWPITLTEVLRRNRSSTATDPRDKVYAFMSIAPELRENTGEQAEDVDDQYADMNFFMKALQTSNIQMQLRAARRLIQVGSGNRRNHVARLVADYKKSVREVYIDAATYIVTSSQSLELLSHVEDRGVDEKQPFPSWVPNYGAVSCPEPFGGSQMTNWSASGTMRLTDALEVHEELLNAEGFLLDTVVEAAETQGDQLLNAARVALHLPPIYRTDLKYEDLNLEDHLCLPSLNRGKHNRPGQILPLCVVREDGSIAEWPEKYLTRVEVLWRTLIFDHLAGHPAPLENGFAFGDWLGTLTMERFVEHHFQKSIASRQALADLARIHEALEADEPGDERKSVESLRNTKEEMDLHLRNSGLAVNLEAGLIRFLPDRLGLAHTALDMEGKETNFEQLNKFKTRFREFNHQRRVFRTEHGWFGNGPHSLMNGDQVWILAAADVPFLLRPQANGRYRLVGEAYVHGIMHGEAVNEESQELTQIVIGWRHRELLVRALIHCISGIRVTEVARFSTAPSARKYHSACSRTSSLSSTLSQMQQIDYQHRIRKRRAHQEHCLYD